MKKNIKWILRALIFPVFFLNVQCALMFLISPEGYAPGFELSGEIGSVVVRGFGILFLMWNVPYFFALVQPMQNFTSLSEAFIMQLIGAVAETLLLFTISASHPMLRASITRFAYFDTAGFLFLAAAWLIGAYSNGVIGVRRKGV